MENFDFKGSEVKVEKKGSDNMVTYAKPGIHEMMYTEITYKTSQSGKPFMDCVGKNSAGESISRQYYLTTTMGPSGIKSAMDITTESLKKLSIAIGRETQYNETTANSPEEFVHKMSAIFTGQWFRTKVKGKEIRKTDGNTFIKGEVSDAFEPISVPASASRLRFDESKDIKYLNGVSQEVRSEAPKGIIEDSSDLPF